MSKKFDSYEVKDVRELLDYEIRGNNDENENEYKIKRFNKKAENVYMFSRKAFSKWSDDHNVQVVGRVRKRQRRYKDYEDYDELVEQKRKKKIFGVLNLTLDQPDKIHKDGIKKYDIKKDKHRHTVGYAWVGGNKFVRVTTFNPLWLLLFLILLCALLFVMLFPSPQNPILDFADGVPVPGQTSDSEGEVRYVAVIPYNEEIVLTSSQKNIPFINPETNQGEYYISFSLYVDGEPFIDKSTGEPYETGLISPDPSKNAILYDLYDQLDAGTYQVKVAATVYDYNTLDKSDRAPTTLSTTVIVEK